MLDGTPESPQEHPHKSRRTLMAPQACEIARCSPNQLEKMPDSPALATEQFPIPQQHSHKMTRTLMSTKERKIARGTPNQLEKKPISPALAP